MFRRVVVSSSNAVTDLISFVYRVQGATVLAEKFAVNGDFNAAVADLTTRTAVVFNNAVRFFSYAKTSSGRQMEYMLDVNENQPGLESVEELTNTGVNITVYNANGVVVCDNGVTIPSKIDGAQAGDPAETVTEPIGDIAEMTGVPTAELTR